MGANPRLSAAHWVIDAHLALPLLDKFIEFFVAEIEGKARRVDEVQWGDETKRLPPALVEVIAEKYRASPSPQSEPQIAEQLAAPVPVSFVL
jgi:hypothetical protein